MRFPFALFAAVLFSLACGGMGSSEPTHGSVAFTTYEAGSTRYVFKTEEKVQMTWRNMVGSAVQGTYTHNGDTVEITWEPATNQTVHVAKLRQLNRCSLALYWRQTYEGEVMDDDSKVFEQSKPKCIP